MLDTETVCSVGNSSDSGSGPPSLQNEFDNIQTVERSAETDSLQHMNQATSPQSDISPVMPTNQAGKLFHSNVDEWLRQCFVTLLILCKLMS